MGGSGWACSKVAVAFPKIGMLVAVVFSRWVGEGGGGRREERGRRGEEYV